MNWLRHELPYGHNVLSLKQNKKEHLQLQMLFSITFYKELMVVITPENARKI